MDRKYAQKKISEEVYEQKTQTIRKEWNKLIDAQINTEKFIENNPLLTSEEKQQLEDLQSYNLSVTSKITSEQIKNAKDRGNKLKEIVENLEKREEELNKILTKIFECPDCENEKIFLEALTKIAQNVGKKNADIFIEQWEDYYKNGVASTDIYEVEMTLSQEMKISSKNDKFKKMFRSIQKGISIKGIGSVMGFYNTYRYKDYINIQGEIVQYKGEVKIKDIDDFHIYAVEFPKSGKNTFDGSEDYQIRFLNKENMVTCILYFSSEKDLNLIWENYYTKEMKKAQENTIKEYDKKHKTQYYKILKK